ncbi:hypothetical protein [Actinoplanes sp. URMC 104]|uniref:hypothetical protein n=1 Tax=Actinoplanes sp. URMC 104 TaxID=3423409 RepID=UPI003F1CB55A
MLFVEAAAFATPVVGALAAAAIVMLASVLVPVTPLDGAHLNRISLLTGAGLLGTTVLLGLGVV